MLHKKSLQLLREDCKDITICLHRLLKSNEDFRNIASLGLLPYLSIVVEGLDKLLELPINYNKIGENSFKQLYTKSRERAKVYSKKRFNQTLRTIKTAHKHIFNDLTKSYGPLQNLFIKYYGQRTLGIFYINGIPFYNNFIGYIDINEIFSVSDIEEVLEEKRSVELRTFSSNLANYILTGYIDFGYSLNDLNKIKGVNIDIHYDDFFIEPVSKRKLINKLYNYTISIFLFNILCKINYILYVFPKIIDSNSNLYYRFKLACYLSTVETLAVLQRSQRKDIDIMKNDDVLIEIIETKRKLDKNSKLRNNIFHYSIQNIAQSVFENIYYPTHVFNKILEYNTSKSREELDEIVSNEFDKIIKLIHKWILQ